MWGVSSTKFMDVEMAAITKTEHMLETEKVLNMTSLHTAGC